MKTKTHKTQQYTNQKHIQHQINEYQKHRTGTHKSSSTNR